MINLLESDATEFSQLHIISNIEYGRVKCSETRAVRGFIMFSNKPIMIIVLFM